MRDNSSIFLLAFVKKSFTKAQVGYNSYKEPLSTRSFKTSSVITYYVHNHTKNRHVNSSLCRFGSVTINRNCNWYFVFVAAKEDITWTRNRNNMKHLWQVDVDVASPAAVSRNNIYSVGNPFLFCVHFSALKMYLCHYLCSIFHPTKVNPNLHRYYTVSQTYVTNVIRWICASIYKCFATMAQ